MPYDWATGLAVGSPLTYHDPRTGYVPGSLAPPQLRPPPKPAPRIPGYDPNSPYGWSGYPVKPTPKATTTTKKSPTATGNPTIDMLIKQIYGSIETPDQQEARVNREVNAQIAAQQKMIDDMYARQRADALRIMEGQSLAGQAAASLNAGLFSQVGGEYNAAAKEIKGLAHGLSGNAAGATAGDVGKANAALQALGNAPVLSGGTFGVGGETQRGVEEYRGGTLPAQEFNTEGEARQFGLAGMVASENLRATQEAQAQLHTTLADLSGKESDAINALASGRLDLYHQYKQDASDARVKALTLVQGLIAQKQSNAQATAKLAAQYQRDLAAQADRDRKFGLATHAQGTRDVTAAANIAKGKAQVAQGNARIKISAGQLAVAQDREMRAALKDMVASGAVDVKRSQALGHVVDKTGKAITDKNGQWISSDKLTTAKTMTPGQSQKLAEKANSLASELFYGYGTNKQGKRVPITQIGGFDPEDTNTYGKGRVPYTQALRTLLRNKVPEAQARAALNALYERGDQGRPFFSQTEKVAIYKKLGTKHYVGLLNTLNHFLQQGHYDAFDALIKKTLKDAGLTA